MNHNDIDPSSISKRVKVDVPIVGNVNDVLDEILKLIEGGFNADPDVANWWKQIDEWRSRDSLRYKQSEHIMPQFVIEKLYEITGGNAFVTSDVGQHQMFAAQYYKFDKPRRWINSGGLGTMGVGLPYAMGVKLYGSPVAGDVLFQALFAVLCDVLARFRETCRILWSRRYQS